MYRKTSLSLPPLPPLTNPHTKVHFFTIFLFQVDFAPPVGYVEPKYEPVKPEPQERNEVGMRDTKVNLSAIWLMEMPASIFFSPYSTQFLKIISLGN